MMYNAGRNLLKYFIEVYLTTNTKFFTLIFENRMLCAQVLFIYAKFIYFLIFMKMLHKLLN